MKPIVRYGWKIYFHPLFFQQWEDLLNRVKTLKQKLAPEDFIGHSDAKLLKAIDQGIKETIPQDPLASYLALTGALRKFSRLKKKGLPNRYRLFFRVFSEQQSIIILWLGFPRKEGDKRDCYVVFEKLVKKGEFPKSMTDFMAIIEDEDTLRFE
jgi:toxin YhaV